jgi:serine/threonine protein kinase
LALGRGGKKVDIYRFGVLLLSFGLGDIIHDPVVVPKGLLPEFSDFVKKCLIKDERDRWSADQLLGHVWIKHRLENIQSPTNVASEVIYETGYVPKNHDLKKYFLTKLIFVSYQ